MRAVLPKNFINVLKIAALAGIILFRAPSAHAACSSPAGVEGQVIYNSAYMVPQYCDNTSWIAMTSGAGSSLCNTTPVEYATPGTYAYTVPAGCGAVTIQAYGAGGAGNDGVAEGGGGGGGGSVVERSAGTLLAAGGGGGGAGADDTAGGGGGGYGSATVSVAPSEQLNVRVGGGGQLAVLKVGGAGGGVSGGSAGPDGGNGGNSTYGGGGGGGDDGTGGGGDSTYGGGGGTGKDSVTGYGGDSVYGGGGGGSDNSAGGGTSVSGRSGLAGDGGGGGGGGGFGSTVVLGGDGASGGTAGGAAANGGPGNGGAGGAGASAGGNGKVVITPIGAAAGSENTPAGCENIGNVCSDGSVYAGLSTDGSRKMYTTPADAAGTYTWNDGTVGSLYTGMDTCFGDGPNISDFSGTTCDTGEYNTNYLSTVSNAHSPYAAAQYCADLVAHGSSDWYLPAIKELNVLYQYRTAIGGFAAADYWSSSESHIDTDAANKNFSTGDQWRSLKTDLMRVRCVRKLTSDGAACNTAETGQIMYNSVYGVPQFCDGNNWISLVEYGADELPAGLVHHWTMDDNAAGTTLTDSVGGANCTLSGTRASITGKYGNAVHFTGGGSTCGSIAAVNNVSQVTLAGWVKRNTPTSYVFVGKGTTDSTVFGLQFWSDNYLYWGVAGAAAGWEEGYSPTNNTDWHHYALVFDGTQTGNANRLKGYIDGQPATMSYNGTIPAATASATSTFMVAEDAAYGAVDDMRIYNRALSVSEIQYLYAATGGSVTAPQIANGYFVEVNVTNANLGGLSGANAYCLTQLTNDTWTGKASAQANGQLASGKVKAWLCDTSTCQNLMPLRTYAYASTISASGGGGTTFTAFEAGYPADDGLSYDDPSAFDTGSLNEYFTGRDYPTMGPQANTCSDWGSTAGTTNVAVSDTGYYPEKIEKYSGNCVDSRAIICMVDPAFGVTPSGYWTGSSPCSAADEGSIVYNNAYNILQFCDGANWKAIGKYQ